MIAQSNNGVAGYFKIEKHQADENGVEIPGSREILADWFPNLITDSGLDFLSSTLFIEWCGVGSGSTAPAFTDTALQTPVGSRISGSIVQGPSGGTPGLADFYSSITGTYEFGQNTVVGNLSEICTAPLSTGSVFSRALILDGAGAPITITVTAIDILTVTYQLRLYRSITDISGSFLISGVTYNTVTRPANINAEEMKAWYDYGSRSDAPIDNLGIQAYTGALGPVTGFPSTASGNVTPIGTLSVYSNGSYYMDNVINANTAELNAVGGIAAIATYAGSGTSCAFQTSFSPVLPKDNTKTMSVTIRNAWARYTP